MAGAPSPPDEVRTIGTAARREAAALAGHVRALDGAGWDAPTWCVGWSVREVVAHLAEGMDRFGQQVRGALDGQPVEFSMAEREARRAQVKALPDDALLARLADNTAAFFAPVESLAADVLLRPVVPMAAGLTPVFGVAQLRLFELAVHRWDVRVPTEPGATVDAEAVALLMDWVLAGAHRQAKRDLLAGLQGTVRSEATGPAGGPVTIVASGEAVQVARDAAEPADATLHLSSEALLRWFWGRLPLASALDQGSVRLEGQRDIALALSRAFGNLE
jgi:uncharacterized protein (TIGR03083 family)